MKKTTLRSLCYLIALVGSIYISSCVSKPEERVQIELLSSPFQFEKGTALSKVTSVSPTSSFQFPSDSSTFSIHFKFKPQIKADTTYLLKIAGVLDIKHYLHSQDRHHQNYPSYPMPDGSIPVLEVDLTLHRDNNARPSAVMRLGIPMASLPNPDAEHEVVLVFTGLKWTMYIDNELVDNEFPVGYPKWGRETSWTIDQSVLEAEVFAPGVLPKAVALEKPRVDNEIQYWTPRWHNSWVGDVVTYYYEGRYHLFYLFDRRGHTGKLGGGGHYFEHISTADFKTWKEHEPAIPLENQWETIGTGTPFIYNDQLVLSYGLHTTRFYPREQTTLPVLDAFYEKNGYSGSFKYDTLSLFPAGSTYAYSEDGGETFKKSKILFHSSENPSVYIDPNGRLRMLANYGAKGTWESKKLDGGWYPIVKDFPPGGDCTFFFHWGKFDYIAGGFSGFWSKLTSAPDDAFEDQVAKGMDFYNGMNVPAFSEIQDGRFLIAAWIPVLHWGGTLVIHEMIQYPDGRLGTKWMDEIIPSTEKLREVPLGKSPELVTEGTSFLLSFDVEPGITLDSKLGVLLLGENGEEQAYEVQISPLAERAQYAAGNLNSFSAPEKSLREGGKPNEARSYAIENLMDTKKPFTVRMIVKHENKYGGSHLDTEIAGQRTMISYRENLKVSKVIFREKDVKIKNIKIAALKK